VGSYVGYFGHQYQFLFHILSYCKW